MRRLLVAAMLLMAIAPVALAQDGQKKAAATDFEAEKALEADALMLSKRAVISLGLADFRMVQRDDTLHAIRKLEKQPKSWFEDSKAAAELGKKLGVELVFAFRLQRVGRTYLLEARKVDVASGAVVSEHRAMRAGEIGEALRLSDELAQRIAGAYTGPDIKAEDLPVGRVGLEYEGEFGIFPAMMGVKWELADGELPEGLKLTGSTIKGVPQKAGLLSFTVRAKVRRSGVDVSTEAIVNLQVKPAPLSLPDMEIAKARLGHRYEVKLAPPAGTPPFKWKKLAGTSPPGLELDLAEGVIKGTPRSRGTYRLHLSVTDSLDPPETTDGVLTIKVTNRINLLTGKLPTAYSGCEYRAKLRVENALEPLKVEVTECPPGFTLKGSDKGLTITGDVSRRARSARVAVRITDATTPVPQKMEKAFFVEVKGFHVANLFSYASIVLHDVGTDTRGNPLILASADVLGSGARWVAFCRWSGRDWEVFPVTAEAKDGQYRLLPSAQGKYFVLAYAKTGDQKQMQLGTYAFSAKGWRYNEITKGNFHFLQFAVRSDGGLVFAYERDGKLHVMEKQAGAWVQETLAEDVRTVYDILLDGKGRKYVLYQRTTGQAAAVVKDELESRTVKLPDQPCCAGLDSKGKLRVFTSCLGETACYVLEGESLKEVGRWKRRMGAGAVFSRSDLSAYAPAQQSKSWGAKRPSVVCAGPQYVFEDITFDGKELPAQSYNTDTLRLAVDGRGTVHAAFVASAAGRAGRSVLAYGQIGRADDFSKIGNAKSFVSASGSGRRGANWQAKSGGCALAPAGVPFSLACPALLALALALLRRRRKPA